MNKTVIFCLFEGCFIQVDWNRVLIVCGVGVSGPGSGDSHLKECICWMFLPVSPTCFSPVCVCEGGADWGCCSSSVQVPRLTGQPAAKTNTNALSRNAEMTGALWF